MSKFVKGNQAGVGHGRPKGSGLTSKFRAAVSDDDFAEIMGVLVEQAKAADMAAIGLLMARWVPVLKSTGQPVNVELPGADEGLLARAEAVMQAVSTGQIAPDEGKALMDGLGVLGKITEVVELERRISLLETARK